MAGELRDQRRHSLRRPVFRYLAVRGLLQAIRPDYRRATDVLRFADANLGRPIHVPGWLRGDHGPRLLPSPQATAATAIAPTAHAAAASGSPEPAPNFIERYNQPRK